MDLISLFGRNSRINQNIASELLIFIVHAVLKVENGIFIYKNRRPVKPDGEMETKLSELELGRHETTNHFIDDCRMI